MMIRNPVVRVGPTLHGRLPALGRAFWYKLRDSSEQRGMEGLPSLTKTIFTGVSASEYTDPQLYQFPNNNDTAGSGVTWKAVEDEDDLYLDQVLTLVGIEADEQIIVACDLAFVEQASAQGFLWSWGTDSTHSRYGFLISTAEVPQVMVRPRTGTSVTTDLTTYTGDAFSAFKNQGRFTAVCSIRGLNSTTVAIQLLLGNGTLEGTYTLASLDVRGDGTANPGISGGSSMANFGGLGIGCGITASSFDKLWGRGASNVGRYDQIIGWRGTYDADLAAAVLEELTVTNRLDFPPSLCSAA